MNVDIYNQDCVTGMAEHLADDSVDLTVTSIPFGALFMYSGKVSDVGNNQDGGADMRASNFGLHMRFVIDQLLRVHKPGTNLCCHIQELLAFGVQHGYMGRRDFRGAVIDLFCAGGWEWKGIAVIPKNPQRIAQQLKLHSLMFVTGARNARDLAPASNDMLLIFQKPGEASPVRALRTQENPGGWVTTEEWIKWAHGCWTDIRETDVLEGWKDARETDSEKHVCPLQMEVVRRCVRLYSNPGELVCDPFSGIGTTPVVALEEGRNAVAFELKESYHRKSLRYVERVRDRGESATVDVFTMLDAIEAAG